MKEKLYSIGEVAKKAEVSTRTLRYYEKFGLIKPDYVADNSYRYYKEDTILKLTIIKYLKVIGFSLEEIKEHLDKQDSDVMLATFDKILEVSEKEIDEIALRREIVNDWKDLLIETKMLEAQRIDGVSLKYMPEKRLISYPIAFDFDYKAAILDLGFSTFVHRRDNKISGPVMFYYENFKDRLEAQDKKTNISAKYIQKAVKKPDQSNSFYIKANFCANIYHYGSHKDLKSSYQKILDWQKTSTYKLKGPVIERFVYDYRTSFQEEKFITELIFPLEKINQYK